MKIVHSNKIQCEGVSPSILSEIKDRLIIINPTWVENEKMGRWQGETPYNLRYYQETASGLIVPRGFIPQLIGIAKRSGERYQIEV